MECCWDGHPFGRFSHLCRGLPKLCWVYLPDQGHSCPVTQFDWLAKTRKSPVHSKRLPFHKYWGHCAPGNILSFINGFIPLAWSMAGHNVIAEVCREFLGLHVNGGTLYIQVCAFLNHVQSMQFVTGGLQSSSRRISRIIKANRMHLITLWSATAQGEYLQYVNGGLSFRFLIHLC